MEVTINGSSAGVMSDADKLRAQIAALQAENELLKTVGTKVRELSFKVSEKKALSVYGLGRFPVTLYKEQWERLLAIADKIRVELQNPELVTRVQPIK